VIRLIAVDPSGGASLLLGSDDHRVTRYSDRKTKPGAELVACLRVGRFHISLLCPSAAAAHKDISRSGIGSAVICLIAVNPSGSAVLAWGSDDNCVTRYRHRAKDVARRRIRSFEIGLLCPSAAATYKHISRSGTGSIVIRLIPVNSSRSA